MEFWSDFIPAIIILFSNLYGGDHTNPRYQIVTAAFGWLAGLGILFGFIVLPVANLFFQEIKVLIEPCTRFTSFTTIAAISRDYERMLKPIADRFFNNK